MKWIELKDLCELYLIHKSLTTIAASNVDVMEKCGMYVLFEESMYSEPTEEEKRVDQMKAEKMLKLAQDRRGFITEIDGIAMKDADDHSRNQAILKQLDEAIAEDARKKAEAEMAKKETDNASSSPTAKNEGTAKKADSSEDDAPGTLLAELGWDVCSQILSTQTSALHYEPEKIPLFQRRSCLYSDCVPLLDNHHFPIHAFSTLRY